VFSKGIVREMLITLALAVVIFLVLQITLQSSIVDGSSMEPGLVNGQRLIVIKAAYCFKAPQRGDIIILHPPVAPENQWVKRVIGLPGDTIEIKSNRVYVNGTALEEPYIKEAPDYILPPYAVPPDNYFVLGDNRNESYDSHRKWTVSRGEIVGEVWLRFWPMDSWGIVRGYPLQEEIRTLNK
jgi:signal peptidase I